MDIQITNRKIQSQWARIGVQGDNRVETFRFLVDRYASNGADLYSGIANLVFELPGQTTGVVKLDVEVSEDGAQLILTWIVGNQITKTPGTLHASIHISGLENEIWHSEIVQFTVAKTILESSLQNPVMSRAQPRTANPLLESPFIVVERNINIPPELQNIAVQNDNNSETVNIVLPRYFDGNDLSKHEIYLRTVNEGGRDDILFTGSKKSVVSNEMQLTWKLQPPQTSYKGKLSIQIMIIGTDFQWSSNPATINITGLIEADPVIPTNPTVYETWLIEMRRVKDEAIAGSKAWADKSKEWADSIYTILDGGRPGYKRELIINGGRPGRRGN